MYVVVHHQITDPEKFLSITGAGVPDHPTIQLHAYLPEVNHKTATCLWTAPDTKSLQLFLDPILGTSSKNTYAQVDEKIGILPKKEKEVIM
jgi:hypothetical protein